MKKIAIIGLGNIGSRHLEGILKCSNDMEVYCVDKIPFKKIRFESKTIKGYKKIIEYNEISSLPQKLDLAIIATTADVRLEVIRELISTCKLDNLILEKVLFQKENDYEIAKRLIEGENIKCWVNCFHPMNPEWKRVFDILKGQSKFGFKLTGNGWGDGM